MKNTLFDRRILDNECCNTQQTEQSSVSQYGSYSSHNTELAAVIIRKEIPEHCRNGCTQSICALEGNLLAGKLAPSGEVDEHENIENELIINETNKEDGKSTVSSLKMNNLETEKFFSGEERRKRVRVHTIRQSRTRFWKPKAKRKSCTSQLLVSYQPPSILSRCKRHLANRNAKPDEHQCLVSIENNNMEMEKHSSKFEKKLHCQNSCSMVQKMIVPERKRQRKVPNGDAVSTSCMLCPDQHETCQPSSQGHCKACSLSLNDKIKSGEDGTRLIEYEVKLKPLPRLDPGSKLIKCGLNPISDSRNVKLTVGSLNRSDTIQNTSNKDVKLADDLVKQECVAAANSTFPCYESNTLMVNIPLVYSDLQHLKSSKEAVANEPLVYSDLEGAKPPKEPKVSHSQVDNNRLLKYTFQRKLKKEALSSSDQNSSLEKSNAKRRAGEKQNGSPDSEKSSMINESSRDSRRLAQVAHQVGFFHLFSVLLNVLPELDVF